MAPEKRPFNHVFVVDIMIWNILTSSWILSDPPIGSITSWYDGWYVNWCDKILGFCNFLFDLISVFACGWILPMMFLHQGLFTCMSIYPLIINTPFLVPINLFAMVLIPFWWILLLWFPLLIHIIPWYLILRFWSPPFMACHSLC